MNQKCIVMYILTKLKCENSSLTPGWHDFKKLSLSLDEPGFESKEREKPRKLDINGHANEITAETFSTRVSGWSWCKCPLSYLKAKRMPLKSGDLV